MQLSPRASLRPIPTGFRQIPTLYSVITTDKVKDAAGVLVIIPDSLFFLRAEVVLAYDRRPYHALIALGQ